MKIYLIILLLACSICSAQKKRDFYDGYCKDTLDRGRNLLFENDSVVSIGYGRTTVGRQDRVRVLYKKFKDSICLTGTLVKIEDTLSIKSSRYTFPATLYIKGNILEDRINSTIYVKRIKNTNSDPLVLLNGKKHARKKLVRLIKRNDFSEKYTLKVIYPYEAYQKFGKDGLNGVINIIPKPNSIDNRN